MKTTILTIALLTATPVMAQTYDSGQIQYQEEQQEAADDAARQQQAAEWQQQQQAQQDAFMQSQQHGGGDINSPIDAYRANMPDADTPLRGQ